MTERPSVSQAIQTLPIRFDMFGMMAAASQLLRARSAHGNLEPLDQAQLQFFIERGLVDPPSQNGSRQIFDRRQLLQVCAVQSLRGAGLDLDRIATVMQGADDDHLRLLCDEPEETAKKAAVMHNWMQMLEKGRYSRADRGGTSLMHQPEVELPVVPPQPPIAPRARVAPSSPSLSLPDPRQYDAPAGAAEPVEFELPDAPPPTIGTVANAAGRAGRETLANSELQRISDQLSGAVHGRTVSASVPGPRAPLPARGPALAPAPAPVAAPAPRPVAPAAPAPRSVSESANLHRPVSREDAGRVWRRHSLAPGVELHIEDGPNGPRPRDARAVLAILERMRQILGQ